MKIRMIYCLVIINLGIENAMMIMLTDEYDDAIYLCSIMTS